MARPKRGARLWWAAALAGLIAVGVADVITRRTAGAAPKGPAALRRLTFAPGLEDEPSFSPDGKFVAYTTDDRGNLDVVVQPLAGGEPIRIASTDADEAEAAWSPDGSRIAFVSAQEHGGRLAAALNVSSLEFYLNSSHGDIFLVPALGGSPAKLVEDGHYPSWSPDGKRIVFMSNRGGQVNLWTVSADGGAPERLTNDANIDYQPAWSPDGKWIAYGSGSYSRGSRGFFNLKIRAAGGGAETNLAEGFTYVATPDVGRRRAVHRLFRRAGRDPERLEVPVRDGRRTGPLSRVTLGQGQDAGAAVSRDGKSLAFAGLRTELEHLGALPRRDSGARRDAGRGRSRLPPALSRREDVSRRVGAHRNVRGVDRVAEGRFLSRLTPGQELIEPSAPLGAGRPPFLVRARSHASDPAHRRHERGGHRTSPRGQGPGPGTESESWSGLRKAPGEIRIYDVETKKTRAVTSLRKELDYPSWSPDEKQIAFQLQRGTSARSGSCRRRAERRSR